MKNLNYILFLLVVIVTSCNSSSFKLYEANMNYINNLKGEIKSIKSESFEATEKFGEFIKGKPAIPYFDLSELMFTIMPPNSTFEFAKNGKEVSRVIGNTDFSYSLKFIYDKKWNILEEHFISEYNDEITKYKIVDNKIVSSISYKKEGEPTNNSEFLYEKNLLKEITTKNNENKLLTRINYSYNNEIQSQNIYNESGKLIQSFKRDIYGRFLEIEMTEEEKILINYEGKYPFPTEILKYKDNEIDGKYEITLDNDKNVSEIKKIKEDGEIKTLYKYNYKYDKQGNWIERIAYEDDYLENITVRTIEYY